MIRPDWVISVDGTALNLFHVRSIRVEPSTTEGEGFDVIAYVNVTHQFKIGFRLRHEDAVAFVRRVVGGGTVPPNESTEGASGA